MKDIIYKFINKLVKEKSKYIVFESNDDFCEGTFEFYKYCLKKIEKKNLVWFISKKNKKKAIIMGLKKFLLIDSNSIIQKIKKIIYARHCRWYCYSHRFLFNESVLNSHAICLFFTHGTPFKYAPVYTKDVSKSSYVLANNSFVKNIYAEIFKIDRNKLFECMNPRIAPLIDVSINSDDIRKKIGVNKNSTLVVMLLTWDREKVNYDYLDCFPFKITSEDLIELNSAYTEKNIFLLIKLHPMVKLNLKENMLIQNKLTNILVFDNGSFQKKDVNLYKLLSCSDALITDYSSVFIDYYLTKKMIYFFEPNIDLEMKKQRNVNLNNGFVFENPKQYMGGSFISSFDDFFLINPEADLANNIEQISTMNLLWNTIVDYDICEKIMEFFFEKEGET